jgi:hypothetical protein
MKIKESKMNWKRGEEKAFNPIVWNKYYIKDVIETEGMYGVQWTVWLLPEGEDSKKQVAEPSGYEYYPGAINFTINFTENDKIKNKGLVSSFVGAFKTNEPMINRALKKAFDKKMPIWIICRLEETTNSKGKTFLNTVLDKWSDKEEVVQPTTKKQMDTEIKEKINDIADEDEDNDLF